MYPGERKAFWLLWVLFYIHRLQTLMPHLASKVHFRLISWFKKRHQTETWAETVGSWQPFIKVLGSYTVFQRPCLIANEAEKKYSSGTPWTGWRWFKKKKNFGHASSVLFFAQSTRDDNLNSLLSGGESEMSKWDLTISSSFVISDSKL